MKLDINSITPPPRFIETANLKKTSPFSGKRILQLDEWSVALVIRQGEAFIATTGELPEEKIIVGPEDTILLFDRELDLAILLSEVRFAGGVSGMATLQGGLRVIGEEEGGRHPLAKIAALATVESTDAQAFLALLLEHLLNQFLAPPLAACLRELEYYSDLSPVTATVLLQTLETESSLLETLRAKSGLSLSSMHGAELRLTSLSCPEIDERAERNRRCEEKKNLHETQTRKKLFQQEQDTAIAQAQALANLQHLARKLEQVQLEAELQGIEDKQNHQHNLLEEERKQKAIETQLLMQQLQKTKAETALAQEQLEHARKKEKTSEIEKLTTIVETFSEEVLLLVQQLLHDQQGLAKPNLSAENDRAEKTVPACAQAIHPPLQLKTTWNRYNPRCDLLGEIQNHAEIESGDMIDVTITTNFDAWVYIFNKSSDGTWVHLLPEKPSAPVMRLRRPNRQTANTPKTWPGENNNDDDYSHIKKWQIFATPGVEHFYVLATKTPLDSENVMDSRSLEELLHTARPRGVRMAGQPGSYRSRQGEVHTPVQFTYWGENAVRQHLAITHKTP